MCKCAHSLCKAQFLMYKEEYEELKQKIASGEIVVDNSSDDATKPTVSEFTNVTYIQ